MVPVPLGVRKANMGSSLHPHAMLRHFGGLMRPESCSCSANAIIPKRGSHNRSGDNGDTRARRAKTVPLSPALERRGLRARARITVVTTHGPERVAKG